MNDVFKNNLKKIKRGKKREENSMVITIIIKRNRIEKIKNKTDGAQVLMKVNILVMGRKRKNQAETLNARQKKMSRELTKSTKK